MSPLPIDLGDGAVLRRLRPDEAPTIFAAVEANRGRLDPWMPWSGLTRTVDDQQAWLDRVLSDEGNFDGTGLFVDGAYAGGVGMTIDPFGVTGEIGYWISREFEGRGLVTRAVKAFIDMGFEELGLHRIFIRAGVDNVRSRAIPERLGFTNEGVLRGEGKGSDGSGFHDLVAYGLLEEEWRAHR
jgi:ribosomal-protein-serine acetyltransferase